MGDNTTCDICDKECKNHGKNDLLIKQHGDRLDNAEITIDAMNADSSNTEGRLNMFIWAIGIVFMLIASMSFYGILQLNDFKDVYTHDNKESQQIISKLDSSIGITNNNVSHIRDEVELLKTEQRLFIINSENQIRTIMTMSKSKADDRRTFVREGS